MTVVLYVQGFRGNNKELITEEISIVDLNKHHVIHAFFKEPYNINELNVARRNEVRWLSKRYHGIEWSYGFIAYDEIGELLRRVLLNYSIIYIKGCEKKNILEAYLSSGDTCKFEIIDIDSFHSESLKVMRIERGNNKCFYHQNLNSSYVCSHENVYNLVDVVNQYRNAKCGNTSSDKGIHLTECQADCFCC